MRVDLQVIEGGKVLDTIPMTGACKKRKIITINDVPYRIKEILRENGSPFGTVEVEKVADAQSQEIDQIH